MERYLEMKVTDQELQTVGELLKKEAGLTKKQISQAKFRPGGIRKNGKQCRVTEKVEQGDVILICLETKETDSVQLESPADFSIGEDFGKIEILYEDQDLLAVNKPSGMVTHPSGIHYADSLSNEIAEYFRSKKEGTRIRSIGRLDKETSGILLFARNRVGAARLQKQREEGRLEKTYLAICAGKINEKELEEKGVDKVMADGENWYKISFPIAKDPSDKRKMKVCYEENIPGSKRAFTYFRILEKKEEYTVLKVKLETGRTHQIRVHMAGIGHPLLGDSLYNKQTVSPSTDFKRAALHAWKLCFFHPFTGKKMVLEAPFPHDFQRQ